MDIKTTFLHGDLNKMIIIAQLEGYVNPKRSDHACHLKMSLYGVKQSPRQWHLRFDSFMIERNFQKCNFDCCVYFKYLNCKIYLLLYVKDML